MTFIHVIVGVFLLLMALIVFGSIVMVKLIRELQQEKKDLLNRVMATDYQKYVSGELSRMREEKTKTPSEEEIIERLKESGVSPI